MPKSQPTGDAPKIKAGSGDDETEPTNREISQGSIKATLSYKEGKTESGEVARLPVVTVFADGTQIAKLEGEAYGSDDPPVSAQIVEIDPANSNPEIVVSFYTGGAHCCSDTKVVTSSKDGSSWRTVEVGEFDGGPLLASDLAGDEHYAFETRDNAFLYTFGGDPRFRPAHEAYMKGIITRGARRRRERLPGRLEKMQLGEGKEAWKLMLAYYDRASD